VDLAKSEIFTGGGNEPISDHDRKVLLKEAIVNNQPEFVQLFLETGIDLDKFFDKKLLSDLYNSPEKTASPLFKLLRDKYHRKASLSIKFRDVRELLVDLLFPGFQPEFLPYDTTVATASDEKFAEKNLFVWSLLFNRIQLAKIFWKISKFQVQSALFASLLLKNMSKNVDRSNDMSSLRLLDSSQLFKDLAINVLTTFSMRTSAHMSDIVLGQSVPFYKDLSCVDLAMHGRQTRFVSLPVVQEYISRVWNGGLDATSGPVGNIKFTLSILSLGSLAPFLVCRRQNMINNKGLDESFPEVDSHRETFRIAQANYINEQHFAENTYFNRYVRFIRTPKVRFTYEMIAYVCFLALFSYTMLCKFDYQAKIVEAPWHLNKSGHNSDSRVSVIGPSLTEWVLILWVFCLAVPEVKYYMNRNYSRRGFKRRSYVDLVGYGIFAVGLLLRLIAVAWSSEVCFSWARVVLVIDLIVWIIRLIWNGLVLGSLGPRILIINEMLKDLGVFIAVLSVVVLSFGVAVQVLFFY